MSKVKAPVTVLCPVTKKQLNCFYLVYSPKEYSEEINAFIREKILEPSPSYILTHEFGTGGKHHHVNYVYYASSGDSSNEKRRLLRVRRDFLPPLIKLTKVTNLANITNYITKGNYDL